MAGLVSLSGRHPLQPLYLQPNPLPFLHPLPHPHSLARPVSRLQGSEGSDDGSPASPAGTTTPPPLSPGQAAQGLEQLLDTPTRKNKRKLSEPRKRSGSDFSIRRLCQGSPGPDGEEEEEMSDSSEDGEDDDKSDDYRRRVLGKVGNRRSSSGAGGSSSFIVGSSSNNNSSSGSGKKQPSHKEGSRKSAGRRQRERPGQRSRAAAKRRRSPRERDDSSSRGPSEREDTPVPLRLSGLSGAGVANGLPITNGLRVPQMQHPAPFFPSGLPPAATALGFLPGFYLGPDGRPAGYPPVPFPGLPLGLPHNPMAFAAASSSTSADPDQHGRIPALRGEHGLPPFPGHAFGLPPHLVGPGVGGSELKAQDLSSRAESPDNSGDDNSSTNDGGGEGGSGEGGEGGSSGGGGRKPRKNYKNMTRERRVEANARERTRVHTISAAFDALRRAVPSYSYNQKLSKLAILRIACTYIMALARLADVDCSAEPSVPLTFADCVDMCTRTIQTEGRARRRH